MKYLSAQTGFIHYCHEAKPGDPHDTIPVLENFAYALSLLRCHQMEKRDEAVALMKRLLPFVSPDRHNFCVYLHEYPNAYDRLIGGKLLPLLKIILDDYGKYLGDLPLQAAYDKILAESIKTVEERGGPPMCTLPIEVLAGQTPDDLSVLKSGSVGLGKAIELGLDLNHYIAHTFHQPTGRYIGPGTEEAQEGYEPKLTPYNIYLGCESSDDDHAKQMAIAHPLEIDHPQLPFTYENVVQDEKYAYRIEDSSVPYRLIWGDAKRTHCLACEGFAGTCSPNLTLTYPEEIPSLDKQNGWETQFFIDKHEGLTFYVNGSRATLFRPGDKLTMQSPRLSIDLTFTILSGEADLVGHFLPGNRPSQTTNRGTNRFETYDYQIVLQTLRRSSDLQLQVDFNLS